MSSLTRRMQRNFARKGPDYEPAPQPAVTLKGGGYKTLRPTKGWVTLSGARLRAQGRMAHLLEHFIPARPKRAPKLYRKPALPAPSVETRQQRRWKARRGEV